MKVQKLVDRVCTSNPRKAISALNSLEEQISPQGAAFTEEAVTAIPLLLEAVTRPEVFIKAEILNYLGDAYAYTLGTWQFRWDDEPDMREHFIEMVAWETSISKSYSDSTPALLSLIKAGNSESVRGSAVYLLSRIKESLPELISTLQEMYGEKIDEPLKADIIEGVANLSITLRLGHLSDVQWLHEKLSASSPAIRLGAALSLMAREEADDRSALARIAQDARAAGESTVQRTAWMARKSIDWALERRVR
ncbi:hypothetical protein [Streptomyces laurentii]|uniref:hypothetical protein n=1 Tax=Streptomyces laurentii TaxID=39478 RepID=UPI0036C7C535